MSLTGFQMFLLVVILIVVAVLTILDYITTTDEGKKKRRKYMVGLGACFVVSIILFLLSLFLRW